MSGEKGSQPPPPPEGSGVTELGAGVQDPTAAASGGRETADSVSNQDTRVGTAEVQADSAAAPSTETEAETESSPGGQLVEYAREQSLREARRIYGTRLESMLRMTTTLLGKGWAWNKGKQGKEKWTEKALRWVGDNIDIPFARFCEENKVIRGLKIAGKATLGAAAVAALMGSGGALAPAAFLIGAPLGVDGVLDLAQLIAERKKVSAWQERSKLWRQLENGENLEQAAVAEIKEKLENSRQVVADLAKSKRRWGFVRFAGKLAVTLGAGAYIQLHGIATGVRDLDHIHQSAAEILKAHDVTVDPGNIRDVRDASLGMLDLAKHGLTGDQMNTLKLASMLSDKHQVIQHLNHAEFLYNKADDMDKILKLGEAGKLDVLQRGAEYAHYLDSTNLFGLLEGVFGAVAGDFALTSAGTSPQKEAKPSVTPDSLSATGVAAPVSPGSQEEEGEQDKEVEQKKEEGEGGEEEDTGGGEERDVPDSQPPVGDEKDDDEGGKYTREDSPSQEDRNSEKLTPESLTLDNLKEKVDGTIWKGVLEMHPYDSFGKQEYQIFSDTTNPQNPSFTLKAVIDAKEVMIFDISPEELLRELRRKDEKGDYVFSFVKKAGSSES